MELSSWLEVASLASKAGDMPLAVLIVSPATRDLRFEVEVMARGVLPLRNFAFRGAQLATHCRPPASYPS